MQTLKVVDSRYQIKARILGRGSYGEVYLCYDTKDSNLKACKMISKQKIVQRINRSESK